MLKKTLILIRGLPATGKSFRAKELALIFDATIVSADHYFGDGEDYRKNWSVEKLGAAHKQCQDLARKAVDEGKNVIVDNTNVTRKDMKPYVDMATAANYEIEYVEPTSDWWIYDVKPYLGKTDIESVAKLNASLAKLVELSKLTHAVPLEAFERMAQKWENI
jgi:hypothetical protein